MGKRLIIDENVGHNTQIWQEFHRIFGNQAWEYLFLGRSHPGIPDVEIFDKLVDIDSVLLTGDRVLHMRVLAMGYSSYTLDDNGKITSQKLPGIHLSKRLPGSVFHSLQAKYHHQSNDEVANRLKASLTERKIKQYRSTRRRIRSYFGAGAAITHASLTVGAKRTKLGILSGFVLNLSGNSGVKGLHATEGYSLTPSKGSDEAYPVIFALRELYLLQLEQIKVDLFVIPSDSLELTRRLLVGATHQDGEIASALHLLLNGLEQPTVQACVKGRFHDAIQIKLEKLHTSRSNEIICLDFAQVATDLLTPTLVLGDQEKRF